jgi:hypothetical protein
MVFLRIMILRIKNMAEEKNIRSQLAKTLIINKEEKILLAKREMERKIYFRRSTD